MASRPLRIGTRGSPMARRQTAIIRDRLIAAHPDLAEDGAVEIVTIRTTGDQVQNRLLAQIEAFEAAQRKNQCIDFTGLHFAQPRVHIPTDRHDREVRAMPQQLGLAAERSSADLRAARQGSKARPANR